jgi:hypothetical protein
VPAGSADAGVFDSCARLASGLAHEFGGLLFALRMRIETLEATAPPEARRDVAALAAGLRELPARVDPLRLLGARAGAGRIVRERAVDAPLWLERTVRLAKHVVPRGVVVTAPAAPAAALAGIDVGRLTAAALLLAAHVGGAPGSGAVSLVPTVDGGRLTLSIRRETPAADGNGVGPGLIDAAHRLLEPIGGESHLGDAGTAILAVPLGNGSAP